MSVSENNNDEGLIRAIGTRALGLNIVNMVVGGGIFVLPGVVAVQLGSAAVLAGEVPVGAAAARGAGEEDLADELLRRIPLQRRRRGRIIGRGRSRTGADDAPMASRRGDE